MKLRVLMALALAAALAGCTSSVADEPKKITAQDLVGVWEDDPYTYRWRVMVLYENGIVTRREHAWDDAPVIAQGRWQLRGAVMETQLEIPKEKGGFRSSKHAEEVTQLQDGKLTFEGRRLERLSAQPKQITDEQREAERRSREGRLGTLRERLGMLEQRTPTRSDSAEIVSMHDKALRAARREAALLDDGGLMLRALNVSFARDRESDDYCDELGAPLFAAMSRGAMSSLESLIANGVTYCGPLVVRAATEAHAIGHTQAVERLWRATFPKTPVPAQFPPGMKSPDEQPGHAALGEGGLPTASKKPVVPAEDPLARKTRGIAALHKAARSGDLLMTKAWLEQGIGAEELDPSDPQKRSALRLAVEGGHKDVIKLLLARGADAHGKDASGQSVLAVAQDKRPELVPLLAGAAP